MIDHIVYLKPDSRYGVPKVFGEAIGRLYADKYGLEVFYPRIGPVATESVDKRWLAIRFSPRDLAKLCSIGLDHPEIKSEIFFGASKNAQGTTTRTQNDMVTA